MRGLCALVDAVRAASAKGEALRAGLWAAAGAMAAAAGLLGLGRDLPAWALLAPVAGLALAALAASAWAWHRRPSRRRAARWIEAARPDLKNALMTLVEMVGEGRRACPDADPGMCAAVGRRAARLLAGTDPLEFAWRPSVRTPAWACLAAAGVLGLALWSGRGPQLALARGLGRVDVVAGATSDGDAPDLDRPPSPNHGADPDRAPGDQASAAAGRAPGGHGGSDPTHAPGPDAGSSDPAMPPDHAGPEKAPGAPGDPSAAGPPAGTGAADPARPPSPPGRRGPAPERGQSRGAPPPLPERDAAHEADLGEARDEVVGPAERRPGQHAGDAPPDAGAAGPRVVEGPAEPTEVLPATGDAGLRAASTCVDPAAGRFQDAADTVAPRFRPLVEAYLRAVAADPSADEPPAD